MDGSRNEKTRQAGFFRFYVNCRSLEIFVWVDRDTVQTDFVMDMRTGRSAGITHRGDSIATPDSLSNLDIIF